jgi:hypothetical protein
MERYGVKITLHVLRWLQSWGQEREKWECMGEGSMRNWDIRKFWVPVNLPSPIQQVEVPTQHVITPICGLLNTIRKDVPLFSHIRLQSSTLFSSSSAGPLHLIHHSTIITSHNGKLFLSISPCHDHVLTPSTIHTEYSIHPRSFVLPSFSWWQVHPRM